MNNIARVRVTARPEVVIKKLSRANIAIYGVKSAGAYTSFGAEDKMLKKVFAIFSHPCYNIRIVKYGFVRSLALRALSRAGLVAGAALFAAAVLLSQAFVLKISVTGSGAHLAPQVVAILRRHGVEEGRLYGGVDSPLVVSQIMSLPSVTFCSIGKRGAAVVVDVQCSRQSSSASDSSPLISPVAGRVVAVAAVCGTPCVSVGDEVSAGDKLILPYCAQSPSGGTVCMCAGYVRISVSASVTSLAAEESSSALSSALAAVNLYSDEAEVTSCTVKRVSQGVLYTINFDYIYTASINMR